MIVFPRVKVQNRCKDLLQATKNSPRNPFVKHRRHFMAVLPYKFFASLKTDETDACLAALGKQTDDACLRSSLSEKLACMFARQVHVSRCVTTEYTRMTTRSRARCDFSKRKNRPGEIENNDKSDIPYHVRATITLLYKRPERDKPSRTTAAAVPLVRGV